MNPKKLILSAIASFAIMFVLSYLWYIVLMKDFYETTPVAATPEEVKAVIRPQVMVQYVALGYAILALLMAYIYPKGVEGDSKIANGLRFGMLMAVLWTLPTALMWHAFAELQSLTMIGVDTIYRIVEEGICGVAIAYIYGIPPKS